MASKATFEEIVYLLINGVLPNQTELNQIDSQLRSNRKIDRGITSLIHSMKTSHPMDVLRTCMSLLSASDSDTDDISIENAHRASADARATGNLFIYLIQEALSRPLTLIQQIDTLAKKGNINNEKLFSNIIKK